MRQACVTFLGLIAATAGGVTAADPNQPTTAPVDMTASDVGATLTRMLLEKPNVPVTPPKGVPRPEMQAEVPVEGMMVVDRLCRLTWDGKVEWFVLTFEPEAQRREEVPRRALPCQFLEQMEKLAAQSPSARFRVSGETTVYEEHAYLLLTKVTVIDEAPAAPAAAPRATPVVQPVPDRPIALDKLAAPAASPTAALTAAPTTQPAGEPSSDDILNQLLDEKVGRPVQVRPVHTEGDIAPSVAPGAGKPLAAGRGAMVVDRLVRVVPELAGPWWEARFEADNTLREPPMRLLPCSLLGRAREIRSERHLGPGPVLRISGLVTRYQGRRYLLLRKVLPERRLNRF